MEIQGLRTETLITYKQAFDKFIEFVGVDFVEEINIWTISNIDFPEGEN